MSVKCVDKWLLALCIAGAFLICIAQVIGDTMLIVSGLLLFLLLSIGAAINGVAMPILFFFLPWSTVLKLAPGGFSFYTIALLVICAVYFVKSQFELNAESICLTVFILSISLVSKCIDESSPSFSYWLFIYLLILFPIAAQEIHDKVDYKMLTVFFSVGIITAALSAQALVNFPLIARYIDVYNSNDIARYSGYYGDPNFYSAHISAALSGVLLMISTEKSKKNTALFFALALTLLYCGLISVSKSFVLTIALVFALWFIAIFMVKGRVSFKLTIVLGLFFTGCFILASGVFSNLLEVIDYRFEQANDASSLTTGRTELWADYLCTIFNDLKLFLFGKGFTHINLHDRGSHSTPIQLIYQFGVLGGVLIAAWLVTYIKSIINQEMHPSLLYTAMMLIGTFLPWFAIDMLFFDEFFLMPVYVCAGIICFSQVNENTAVASFTEVA